MKFVIKSGSVVKLFSGEVKIEALAQFLKENFTSWNSNNLTYTDKDGDKITLTTQEDLDALIAMNPLSQYAKLEIAHEKTEEKEEQLTETKDITKTESALNVQTLAEEIKESKPRKKSYRGKRSSSRSPKKWHDKEWREEKLKKKKKRSPSAKEQKPSSSEGSESDSPSNQRLQKIEGLINQKVAEMVDQRIKNLIPCLKNQLSQTFEISVVKKSQNIQHEGIACNGCSMNPIIGIRYRCLECPTFNFCGSCEEKIEHEHNLLKMKKPQEKSESKRKNGGLWRQGKKLLREMKHRGTSSESEHDGHHRRHRHCRGKGRFGHDEDYMEHKINKKMYKLRALFGEQENFREFIQKHPQLKAFQLLELYATQNNITPEQFQAKRDAMRKEKLGAFYDRPQEEFDQVVKTYPKLNFREIIIKLKETGERTYTGENFKKMREKFRRYPVEQDSEAKIESKRARKSVSKPKESKRKNSRGKSSDRKEKELILNSMKSLFGEEKVEVYNKFIEENFALGQEGIIARWIEKITA